MQEIEIKSSPGEGSAKPELEIPWVPQSHRDIHAVASRSEYWHVILVLVYGLAHCICSGHVVHDDDNNSATTMFSPSRHE